MPTLGEFFFGFTVLGAGIIMIIFARKIVVWFGNSATFEKYLGSGGTYTGLRLVGALFILVGFTAMIGRIDDVLLSLLRAIGLSK